MIRVSRETDNGPGGDRRIIPKLYSGDITAALIADEFKPVTPGGERKKIRKPHLYRGRERKPPESSKNADDDDDKKTSKTKNVIVFRTSYVILP